VASPEKLNLLALTIADGMESDHDAIIERKHIAAIRLMRGRARSRGNAGSGSFRQRCIRGRYLRPFARVTLALVCEREHQPARQLLAELVAEFPSKPVFSHELAFLDQNFSRDGTYSRAPVSSRRNPGFDELSA
jgi:hypothetical protein